MPKLVRVLRLDGRAITKAQFTPEGYLEDRPILTSVGIFEYANPDGSMRRELRLPEEVFDPESLASYKGKPIIISHDAGLIDKDNVAENQIGTILTDGYRSGDDVRAEIYIHDTDAMKKCGLKELSLGYSLDLDETPGEYHGQHYDAIQRNIRINHLALVANARAGEQARLNIDSRDKKNGKGDKNVMAKGKRTSRADGILTPEELQEAIVEYRKKYGAKQDAEEEGMMPPHDTKKPVKGKKPVMDEEPQTELEGKLEEVRANRGRRDEEGTPENMKKAKEVVARQDEDVQILLDIIDTLLAEKAFDEAEPADEEMLENQDEIDEVENLKGDADEEFIDNEENTDADEFVEEDEQMDADEDEECMDAEDEEFVTEEEEEVPPTKKMNTDSIDAIVRTRVQLGLMATKLNLDGVENMSIKNGKKAIIRAVRPNIRLDGKSNGYINALYDCCVNDVKARSTKDTGYQKRQMFNRDASDTFKVRGSNANDARQRMIERQIKRNKEDK